MAAPATPLVHLKVQVSGILSTTVQELWDVLRDYAQAQTWLGTYRGVKTFTTLLPGSINCQIGAARYVTFGHLGFVDQLEALDDERYIMKYKLISHPENTNPFPGAFLNYQAVIHLEEITRGTLSFMKWTGEFDTEPQDCENMRQAITEVFEAGFLGLEAMIMSVQPGYHAPSTAPLPSMGALRAGPGMRGTLGEIQHSMANLHLKHSASMPVHLYNPMPPQEYPNMPRQMGPPGMPGYMGEISDHNDAPPVENGYAGTSPRQSDAGYFGRRPGSGGQLNQIPNQWTSGGSGSTVNISTLPQQFSGGAESDNSGRRVSRPWRGADRIPEGSLYTDGSAQPQQEQQAVGTAEPGHRYQPDRRQPSNQDLHRRDASLGSASSEQPFDYPYQQNPAQPADPLLQEREEFKAVLLATQKLSKNPSDSSLYSGHVAGKPASEPDWSQVMQHKDEDVRVASLSNSGVSSPHNTHAQETPRGRQYWAGPAQPNQAEGQVPQKRGNGSSRSPGPATAGSFTAGGPFAAVNRTNNKPAAQGTFQQQKPVQRWQPHQSLTTMSPVTSSAVDRSGGSLADERP